MNSSLTFESSDNCCKLIGQYSVLLLILTFDWLMESIQIFSQTGQFAQSWYKRSRKNDPIYFKFEHLEKIIKK